MHQTGPIATAPLVTRDVRPGSLMPRRATNTLVVLILLAVSLLVADLPLKAESAQNCPCLLRARTIGRGHITHRRHCQQFPRKWEKGICPICGDRGVEAGERRRADNGAATNALTVSAQGAARTDGGRLRAVARTHQQTERLGRRRHADACGGRAAAHLGGQPPGNVGLRVSGRWEWSHRHPHRPLSPGRCRSRLPES